MTGGEKWAWFDSCIDQNWITSGLSDTCEVGDCKHTGWRPSLALHMHNNVVGCVGRILIDTLICVAFPDWCPVFKCAVEFNPPGQAVGVLFFFSLLSICRHSCSLTKWTNYIFCTSAVGRRYRWLRLDFHQPTAAVCLIQHDVCVCLWVDIYVCVMNACVWGLITIGSL